MAAGDPAAESLKAELSPSFGGRVTSLLLVQKRSNQEKTTPRLRALRASLPARSAVGLRGLSTAPPVLTPNWFASLRTTLRAFLHPPAASEGPRVERRASCAYFSEGQIKNKAIAKQWQSNALPLLLLLRFQILTECGPRWPAALPGPLCGGESGTIGRAAGIGTDADAFSSGQESCRKARPRLTDLPGRSPASAKRGGLSLWLAFSLATQRESNSGAEGARKLSLLRNTRHPNWHSARTEPDSDNAQSGHLVRSRAGSLRRGL